MNLMNGTTLLLHLRYSDCYPSGRGKEEIRLRRTLKHCLIGRVRLRINIDMPAAVCYRYVHMHRMNKGGGHASL